MVGSPRFFRLLLLLLLPAFARLLPRLAGLLERDAEPVGRDLLLLLPRLLLLLRLPRLLRLLLCLWLGGVELLDGTVWLLALCTGQKLWKKTTSVSSSPLRISNLMPLRCAHVAW